MHLLITLRQATMKIMQAMKMTVIKKTISMIVTMMTIMMMMMMIMMIMMMNCIRARRDEIN